MQSRIVSFSEAAARHRLRGGGPRAAERFVSGEDADVRLWRRAVGGDVARPAGAALGATGDADKRPANFKFWRGASGRSYVHSCYGLITCPDLPASVCVLSRRAASDGVSVPLAVLRLESDAESLNLARVRQLGATLGANEVHVHVLAVGSRGRRNAELDLSAGLLSAAAGTTIS